jgi:hypothetical protein
LVVEVSACARALEKASMSSLVLEYLQPFQNLESDFIYFQIMSAGGQKNTRYGWLCKELWLYQARDDRQGIDTWSMYIQNGKTGQYQKVYQGSF